MQEDIQYIPPLSWLLSNTDHVAIFPVSVDVMPEADNYQSLDLSGKRTLHKTSSLWIDFDHHHILMPCSYSLMGSWLDARFVGWKREILFSCLFLSLSRVIAFVQVQEVKVNALQSTHDNYTVVVWCVDRDLQNALVNEEEEAKK